MIDSAPSGSWLFYVLCCGVVGSPAAQWGCCIRVEWQGLICLCVNARDAQIFHPLWHWLNWIMVKEPSQHDG